MNVQEQLQMYRQKFENDTQQAKQEVDPFTPVMRQQTQEQQQPDPFLPKKKVEGVNAPAKEGYSKRVQSFADRADNDSILSKDRDTMHEKVLRLRSIIQDPSNPIDQEKGMELLSNILSKMDADEMEIR